MADRTFNKVYRSEERGMRSMIVKNAVQLYGGMLVGSATADGFIDVWNNVATTIFWGLLLQDVLGATGATPPATGRVNTAGVTLKGVAVAGTPTQAKIGSPVYSQTSNPDDMTMTAATSRAIGLLVAFRTASDCDVQLFTPVEFLAFAS
jgi:hypothetical protein